MFALPRAALPLLRSVAGACVLPTAKRFLTLMFGAILTTGRRTISNLLRAVRGLAPGHPSSYHRVFSRRRWSLWPLAHGLADLILRHWVPEGSVGLAGDDTVDEHRGAKVYGKGRHRDPVRSTHSYTAYRWGHKWVVLAILVRFPFARRPWALPVLVALYRSREWNREHRRRHKTPAQLLRQLVAVLLHWFPHRHFTLTGDGGYGSHEMARFAHRHRRRLTLVSRFVPDAQLYDAPAGDHRQAARPSAAQEGGEAADPGGHRGGDRAGGPDGLQCLLVRRRPARHRGGDRHGELVPQRRGVGPAPLGLCPRSDRDAPR